MSNNSKKLLENTEYQALIKYSTVEWCQALHWASDPQKMMQSTPKNIFRTGNKNVPQSLTQKLPTVESKIIQQQKMNAYIKQIAILRNTIIKNATS